MSYNAVKSRPVPVNLISKQKLHFVCIDIAELLRGKWRGRQGGDVLTNGENCGGK